MAFQANAFQNSAFQVEAEAFKDLTRAGGAGGNKDRYIVQPTPPWISEPAIEELEEAATEPRPLKLRTGRKAPKLELVEFEPIDSAIKIKRDQPKIVKRRVYDDIEALMALGEL